MDMIREAIPQTEALSESCQLRGKILLVDDDSDQADALASRLTRLGFETLTEHQGGRAVRRAGSELPDLVLLDLGLPDMDGLDVCRHLVDSPETCGIPVIIVSGREGSDIVRECRSAGSDFFVRKPYDPNVLLTLIQHSLQAW
jgi:CheY-like chemotaxis protein